MEEQRRKDIKKLIAAINKARGDSPPKKKPKVKKKPKKA